MTRLINANGSDVIWILAAAALIYLVARAVRQLPVQPARARRDGGPMSDGTDAVLYDVQGPKARRRVLIGSLVAALRPAGRSSRSPRCGWPTTGSSSTRSTSRSSRSRSSTSACSEGLLNTLKAAAYALVLALLLGIVLAFGRLSSSWFVRLPAVAVVEFFRGVPLLLLILFFFLAFPLAFQIELPALWALVFGLTLYNGAVIAEIIRAGVLSLPKGQTEAALAVGLTRGQTLRAILLPQAVRIMLPALVSQLVVLLKDTSLGFVIGYAELLRTGGQLVQVLDNPIQLYVAIALIYIAINLALGRLAGYLEGRQRAHHGHARGRSPPRRSSRAWDRRAARSEPVRSVRRAPGPRRRRADRRRQVRPRRRARPRASAARSSTPTRCSSTAAWTSAPPS